LPLSPLQSVFLKLKRAEHHRQTLDAQASEFFGHEPERVVAKRDEKRQWTPFLREPLPPDWPGIAGDCLQNLRSALEHIPWACALRATDSPPESVTFPIRNDSHAWDSWAGKKSVKAARAVIGEDAWTILHDVQPYKNGNVNLQLEPLWMLNELARLDRHQTLHLALVTPTTTRMSAQPLPLRGNIVTGRDSRPDWPRFATPVFDDPELAGSVKINDTQIRTYPQVVFMLCLGPNQSFNAPVALFENLEIIETYLRQLIVPRFQNLFR